MTAPCYTPAPYIFFDSHGNLSNFLSFSECSFLEGTADTFTVSEPLPGHTESDLRSLEQRTKDSFTPGSKPSYWEIVLGDDMDHNDDGSMTAHYYHESVCKRKDPAQ